MDNLVLLRVAATLDVALRQAVLIELRQDAPHLLRLTFESAGGRLPIVLSLRPQLPWIGRPPREDRRPRRPPSPFAATCARALCGLVLQQVAKPPAERRLHLAFTGGATLVVELMPHAANGILLDARQAVIASARRPPSAPERLGSQLYEPRSLPPGKLDPFAADSATIDRHVAAGVAAGETVAQALSRRLLGIGPAGAGLVAEEARRDGRTPGAVLADRLASLVGGELDPVIEGIDLPGGRILPWRPDVPPVPPLQRFAFADAAETAGHHHAAIERAAELEVRASALQAVRVREIRRLAAAEERARADRAALGEPDQSGKLGEALLAGLANAHRVGESVIVPDPYDPDGGGLIIPVPAGVSLTAAAEGFFEKRRRARRGIAHAARRLTELAERRRSLELLAEPTTPADPEQLAKLEQELQRQGVPVGLENRQMPGRRGRALAAPRVAGVRLLQSADGLTILVGKGARENDRLTFKLSAPDDFWLHALGVVGAHVIVRNDTGLVRPPERTLREAAAAAAWYSDAREQPLADVQWTRRKYVRRARGGSPGAVIVKKSETIRVRPGLSPRLEES